MDFGEVLSKAWQIIWKHKVLWIFGILAGCSSSSGGGGGGNLRYSVRESELPPNIQNFFRQFEQIPDWQIATGVAILILIVLVLVVLAVFLSTMGKIGLIRGTRQVERGADRLEFGELFSGSLPYFWRVFLLNVVVGLAIAFGIGVLTVLGVLGTIATLGVFLICLIPLICLLAPFLWLVSVFVEQANIAIVTEELGVIDGLKRGWQVFRDNLGTMIVMGLVLFLGVGLIGGFIIALPVVLIIIPAAIGVIAESGVAAGEGLLISGLCLVAYLPVWLILNGILTGYIESAWTLTFLRLTAKPVGPERAVLEPSVPEPPAPEPPAPEPPASTPLSTEPLAPEPPAAELPGPEPEDSQP